MWILVQSVSFDYYTVNANPYPHGSPMEGWLLGTPFYLALVVNRYMTYIYGRKKQINYKFIPGDLNPPMSGQPQNRLVGMNL